MAIVVNNLLLESLRGTIGRQLTVYERNGQVIAAKKRTPTKKKPTQKQLDARKRMANAVYMAQAMMEDPEIREMYAAMAGPGQNAFNIAVRDAYHAPEVQQVKVEKDTVVVTAKNEFRVAQVKVTVVDSQGEITASGKAELGRNGVDWYYKVDQLPPGSRVIANVRDLPGNETLKECLV